MTWIKEGGENSPIFHQSIKQRRVRNSVYDIYNMASERQDDNVAELFWSITSPCWVQLMLR